MKGVMVIYLVLALWCGIAEGEGYTGFSFSGNETMNVDELQEISYIYTNASSMQNPISAGIGLVNTFLSILGRSLLFMMHIDGAPLVVNLFISVLFAVLGWVAFYDAVVMIAGLVIGALNALL